MANWLENVRNSQEHSAHMKRKVFATTNKETETRNKTVQQSTAKVDYPFV